MSKAWGSFALTWHNFPTRKAGKAARGWSLVQIKPTLNSSGLLLHRCWYKTQEFKYSIWRQFFATLRTPENQWVLNFTIRQTVCQIPLLCLVPNTEYLLSLLLKSSQMWALSVFVINYSLCSKLIFPILKQHALQQFITTAVNWYCLQGQTKHCNCTCAILLEFSLQDGLWQFCLKQTSKNA